MWLSIDPLAEQTPNWSPYAFCNNNPLFFTDPTGMSAEPPPDSGGWQIGSVWEDNDGSWTRAEGSWRSNNDCQESIIDNVLVEGKTSKSLGDRIVGGLRDLDSWFYSNCFGTSTVDEDAIQSFNAGIKYKSTYGNVSSEVELGIYSVSEYSFGFYSKETIETNLTKVDTKGFNVFGGLNSTLSLFAKANTNNSFNNPEIKFDSKVKFSGSYKVGTFNITGNAEKSLISGKTAHSYGLEGGFGVKNKAEQKTTISVTKLNKTGEF